MGVTVEVSSLEEMCDLMCGNILPGEKDDIEESNELEFEDEEDCFEAARQMLDDGYVVMISREDDLWILNYLSACGRDDVMFMSLDEYYKNMR